VFALHVNILGSIDQFQDQMNPSCHWELTIDDGSPRRIVLYTVDRLHSIAPMHQPTERTAEGRQMVSDSREGCAIESSFLVTNDHKSRMTNDNSRTREAK